jgi:hypothetical protein
MEERNLFDNDMRSRFEGFSPEPPAHVWYSVRDAIVVAPRRSMTPVYFRVAAAIAFLAISALSVWMINTDQTTTMPLADQESTLEAPTATPAETPVAESVLSTPPAASQMAAVSSQHLVADNLPAAASSSQESNHQAETFTEAYPASFTPLTPAAHIAQTALAWQQASSLSGNISVRQYGSGSQLFATAMNDIEYSGASSSFAQAGGVTFGIHVSPRVNDRHIAQPGSLASSALPFGSHEQSAMSYGYGMSASIPVSPRLSIQTGASYASMTQMINDINAYSHADNRPFYDPGSDKGFSHPQNIVTSFGVIQVKSPSLYFTDDLSERVLISNEAKYPLDLPEDPKLLDLQSQQLSQSFSFIEIPLIARYQVFENRYFGIAVKAGIAGNILVRNDVLLSQHGGSEDVIGQTDGIRRFNYSGIGGLAITVPLTNRFRLFVEPTAQMFMQPILRDDMLSSAGKTYPYCFSVASGISFRF